MSTRLGPVRTTGPGRKQAFGQHFQLFLVVVAWPRSSSRRPGTLLTVFFVEFMNIGGDPAVKPVVDVHKVRPSGDLGPRYP